MLQLGPPQAVTREAEVRLSAERSDRQACQAPVLCGGDTQPTSDAVGGAQDPVGGAVAGDYLVSRQQVRLDVGLLTGKNIPDTDGDVVAGGVWPVPTAARGPWLRRKQASQA